MQSFVEWTAEHGLKPGPKSPRMLGFKVIVIGFSTFPASRRRGGRIGQCVEEGVGGHFGGVDAVGDSDAVVGDARQVEPGILGEMAANRGDAIEMAEVVLGHRPRMAADPREQGLARRTDQANPARARTSSVTA